MNAIEYIKKYKDTKEELDKMNNLYTDLVQKYLKMQSELEESKKEIVKLEKWLTYSKMTSAQLRDEFANNPPIK
tara:strand:+ start:452 stop:673 length:222 start_codon:yes stop_codon:yes gene_type:complete